MLVCFCVFFLSIRRPPRSTRTDTRCPYTTLFRSLRATRRHHSGWGWALVSARLGHGVRVGRTRSPHRPIRAAPVPDSRSEEHTSELQSLMRISYAVFCLKKNTYIPYIFLSTHHKCH